METPEVLYKPAERLTINLTSARALEINEDRDWLRARVLLGTLYRKYGTFFVEVTEIGKYAIK